MTPIKDTGRGTLETVEALQSARLDFHHGLDKLDRVIESLPYPHYAGVSVTVDEATLPNGDTAGCGAETNSPAALGHSPAAPQGVEREEPFVGDDGKLTRPPGITKAIADRTAQLKVLEDRYKGGPVNPLKAVPPAAPVDAGVWRYSFSREQSMLCNVYSGNKRIVALIDESEAAFIVHDHNAALASSQPVLDREKIAQVCVIHADRVSHLLSSIDGMYSGESIKLDGIERDILVACLRSLSASLTSGGGK